MMQRKKLDPLVSAHLTDQPSDYSPEELEALRVRDTEYARTTLKDINTKFSTIAYIKMWQINDEARGNLAVGRQLFKVALQEFKKYNVEYIVGKYVSQRGEGLSVAPYARDMYRRLAEESGGEVHRDGNVWISVAGLERWLSH